MRNRFKITEVGCMRRVGVPLMWMLSLFGCREHGPGNSVADPKTEQLVTFLMDIAPDHTASSLFFRSRVARLRLGAESAFVFLDASPVAIRRDRSVESCTFGTTRLLYSRDSAGYVVTVRWLPPLTTEASVVKIESADGKVLDVQIRKVEKRIWTNLSYAKFREIKRSPMAPYKPRALVLERPQSKAGAWIRRQHPESQYETQRFDKDGIHTYTAYLPAK